MKTNFKTGILAIALLASVTGAFASDISSALSNKRITYNWQKLSRSGTVIATTTNTSSSNPYPADCNGATSTVCAQATVQGEDEPSVFFYYPPAP